MDMERIGTAETSEDLARATRLLRDGDVLFPERLSGADRELAHAFETAVERWVSRAISLERLQERAPHAADPEELLARGVRRWAFERLLGGVAPRFLVASSVHEGTPDHAGRAALLPGAARSFLLRGADKLWLGEEHAACAPVAHTSWVLPLRASVVELRVQGSHLCLGFDLGLDSIDDLPLANAPAELDVYCDAGDGPETATVLEDFATLLAGRWPESIAGSDDAAGCWPRRGVRPPWTDSDGPPAELFDHLPNPLAARFARLPLAALVEARTEGGRIEVVVEVGAEHAASLAARLSGRLRLDCALFWNMEMALHDRRPGATGAFPFPLARHGETASGPPLVLECVDETGRAYSDLRWRLDADPARTYRVDLDDHPAGAFGLRFAGDAIPPERLRVRYLMPSSWEAARLVPDQTELVARGGEGRFVLRAPVPTPLREEAARDAQLLAWSGLTRSRRLATRAELIDALREELPAPLVRALAPGVLEEGTGIEIETRLAPRSRRGRPARSALVSRIHLPCRPSADHEALGCYLPALTSRLEQRCLLDLQIEVVLIPAAEGVCGG